MLQTTHPQPELHPETHPHLYISDEIIFFPSFKLLKRAKQRLTALGVSKLRIISSSRCTTAHLIGCISPVPVDRPVKPVILEMDVLVSRRETCSGSNGVSLVKDLLSHC